MTTRARDSLIWLGILRAGRGKTLGPRLELALALGAVALTALLVVLGEIGIAIVTGAAGLVILLARQIHIRKA